MRQGKALFRKIENSTIMLQRELRLDAGKDYQLFSSSQNRQRKTRHLYGRGATNVLPTLKSPNFQQQPSTKYISQTPLRGNKHLGAENSIFDSLKYRRGL